MKLENSPNNNPTAYILLGSNMGDKLFYIKEAIAQITMLCGNTFSQSSLYETAPWGNLNQDAFLNQVIGIATQLQPLQLLETLLQIETKLGRIRTEKYGPRTIDIDILLMDDTIIDTPTLSIPHKELQNRRFVLIPLAEIAPNLLHPIFNLSMTQLLQTCNDTLDVKKI